MEQEKLPWLLKTNQLTLLAAVLPPIALIVIRMNRHRLSKKTAKNEHFFASIMLCFWLIKLLPHHWVTLTLLLGLISIFLAAMITIAYKE